MNIAWNRWCRNLPSGTPLSLYDNRIIPIIITDITGRCNVRIQNPYTCTTSSAPSHRRFQTCANSWIPALGPPFFFLMNSMGSSAKPDLASFPGSCAGEEEREPGTHCSRMRQVPLVTCILLRYTKITVNFCLPPERSHCMVILPVGHIRAVLKSKIISL